MSDEIKNAQKDWRRTPALEDVGCKFFFPKLPYDCSKKEYLDSQMKFHPDVKQNKKEKEIATEYSQKLSNCYDKDKQRCSKAGIINYYEKEIGKFNKQLKIIYDKIMDQQIDSDAFDGEKYGKLKKTYDELNKKTDGLLKEYGTILKTFENI